MRTKNSIKILTGNIIQTEVGFVAYFDEYPELFAQGNTEEETKQRLVRGLQSLLKRRKSEVKQTPGIEGVEGKVTHFELTAAI